MSSEDVLSQIQELRRNGEHLSKKKVKQEYPQLMRSALFYFPSWEHAVQHADEL